MPKASKTITRVVTILKFGRPVIAQESTTDNNIAAIDQVAKIGDSGSAMTNPNCVFVKNSQDEIIYCGIRTTLAVVHDYMECVTTVYHPVVVVANGLHSTGWEQVYETEGSSL